MSLSEYGPMTESVGRELLRRLWDLHEEERKAQWDFMVTLTTEVVKILTRQMADATRAITKTIAASGGLHV